MVEGKGFVGHVSNNRGLLQHTRVQNAAEHGTPRNQAQPGFCRCPAGEALLCGPRRPRWTLQTRPNVDGAKPAIGSGRSSECVVARSLLREQVAFSGISRIAPPAEIVGL